MISSPKFQSSHLKGFKQKEIFNSEADVHAKLHQLTFLSNVHMHSILLDGETLGIIGINKLWPGTGEVWSVLSHDTKKAPIAFHREVLRLIVHYETLMQLFRIQMTVREDYPEGRRWAEMLGFQAEGVLRKFAPGQINHVMYSRVNHV